MSNLEEKQICREEIFHGVALHVVKDEVLLPNGNKSVREISLHVGASAVIPILGDGRVIMERQYRYAHHRVMLEIPAGKLEKGENPYEAGMRELREETGYKTDKLTSLGDFLPTPAYCSEKIYLYMANNLEYCGQDLDDDEFLSVEKYPLDVLHEMVLKNEINDSKTVIAILKAKAMLK
mgnify:CR=1 FL=1